MKVSERELSAAWREAMRVWVRTHDRGRVASYLAGLSPELRGVLLGSPEWDHLRGDVEVLLCSREKQAALL